MKDLDIIMGWNIGEGQTQAEELAQMEEQAEAEAEYNRTLEAEYNKACEEQQAFEKALEARIAELGRAILCAKCNDHIIADDGAICEICADTQDTVITELQARVAELEQELKNQVELHNEWLGTYRIKLDYIEELERKIKRLTT